MLLAQRLKGCKLFWIFFNLLSFFLFLSRCRFFSLFFAPLCLLLFFLVLLQDTKLELKIFLLLQTPLFLFLLTPKILTYKIKVHVTSCRMTRVGQQEIYRWNLNCSAWWQAHIQTDHKQDLDPANTTTQRGTKIQQSKLNGKIVGHKRGYRTTETRWTNIFVGSFVDYRWWTRMNLKGKTR